MPVAAADVLSVLHRVLLAAFVGGTSVLMLLALIGRLRIRRPLLVWRTGPLTSLPLGPSLFLGLVAAGLGYAVWADAAVAPSIAIGYPAGGVFWFVATWLARTTVITEYGVIHDITRIHRSVAWGQITDYVETTRQGRPHFVFLYRADDDSRERLDLLVPKAQQSAFRTLVTRKVDARLHLSDPAPAVDEETLDELDRP